jgi:hypothetical protein
LRAGRTFSEKLPQALRFERGEHFFGCIKPFSGLPRP